MQLDDTVLDYLKGERFDTGLRVNWHWSAEDFSYQTRQEWLAKLCQDKRIIHVGCVDHSIDLLQSKIQQNQWLHGFLDNITQRCFGIDTQADGIRYMREQLGFEDTEASDVLTAQHPDLRNQKWDQLLLAEVLEHIDNPVAFLSQLRECYQDNVSQLIVTVPNAFAKEVYQQAMHGKELINSDHRYWFTPYTLCKVSIQAGFKPSQLLFCRNGRISTSKYYRNCLFKRRPLSRNCIIMLADFV